MILVHNPSTKTCAIDATVNIYSHSQKKKYFFKNMNYKLKPFRSSILYPKWKCDKYKKLQYLEKQIIF